MLWFWDNERRHTKTKNLNPTICRMYFWEPVSFGSDGSALTGDRVFELKFIQIFEHCETHRALSLTALQPNMQAVTTCFVTCLSGAVGGITWVLLDYRHEKKYSALGFCVGAVAGLVCCTPACGFISPASRYWPLFFNPVVRL